MTNCSLKMSFFWHNIKYVNRRWCVSAASAWTSWRAQTAHKRILSPTHLSLIWWNTNVLFPWHKHATIAIIIIMIIKIMPLNLFYVSLLALSVSNYCWKNLTTFMHILRFYKNWKMFYFIGFTHIYIFFLNTSCSECFFLL